MPDFLLRASNQSLSRLAGVEFTWKFETGDICVLKRCLFQKNPEVGCSGVASIQASWL